MSFLGHLLLFSVWLLLSLGLGRQLSQRLRPLGSAPVDTLSQLGLGLMLVTGVAFILCSLHIYTAAVAGGCALLGIVWSCRSWPSLWQDAQDFGQDLLQNALASWTTRLGILAWLAFSFFNVLGSHLPDCNMMPYAWMPFQYIIQHGFVSRFDFWSWHIPSPYELLISTLHWFGDERMNPLASAGFGILSSLALYQVVRSVSSRKVALASTVIFVAQPMVMSVSNSASPDFWAWFFALLGIHHWLTYHREDPRLSRALLAAFFLAHAFAIKLVSITVLISVATIHALWVFSGQSKLKLKTALLHMALALLVALIPVLPWFIKTYLYTGNPLWPFAYAYFGGPYWSLHDHHLLFGVWNQHFKPLEFYLTIPFQIANNMGTNPTFAADTGMLTLALVPVSLLLLIRSRVARLTWAAFAVYLFWIPFTLSREPRYAYGIFLFMPFLSALSLEAIAKDGPRYLRKALPLYLGLNLLLLFGLKLHRSFPNYPGFSAQQVLMTASGLIPRTAYDQHFFGPTLAARDLLEKNLEPGTGVLIYSGLPSNFAKPFVVSMPLFQRYIDYDQMHSVSDFMDWCHAHKISYVWWTADTPGRFTVYAQSYIKLMPQVLATLEPVLQAPPYTLYKLKE